MLVALALVLAFVDRACAGSSTSVRGQAPAAARRASPGPTPVASLPLSAGACQALAPTGHSRNTTVFLDAGHGGPDPGVVALSSSGAQISESTLALAVTQDLASTLRAAGYRVVLSRSRDTSVLKFPSDELDDGSMTADEVREDLQARVHCAIRSGASILVSVHFNGYQDSSVVGAQTIYDAVRPFAPSSERLAMSVQSSLVAKLGVNDRGVITDDDLQAPTLTDAAGSYGHLVLLGPAQPGWLDQGTTMPGVLVEPLFLTAPSDARLVTSAAGQKRVAGAIASGIESYLDTSR